MNGHTHTFRITATLVLFLTWLFLTPSTEAYAQVGDNYQYTVVDCDNNGPTCLDGHTKVCETDDQCKA